VHAATLSGRSAAHAHQKAAAPATLPTVATTKATAIALHWTHHCTYNETADCNPQYQYTLHQASVNA
jgi:hypothetical protein